MYKAGRDMAGRDKAGRDKGRDKATREIAKNGHPLVY